MHFLSPPEMDREAYAGTKLGQCYKEAQVPSHSWELVEQICVTHSHSLTVIFVSGEV